VATYSLRTRSTVTTSAAANTEVRSNGTARPRIMEAHSVIGAATASSYGFGRPAAIGVTPTSPVTVLAEDPADPAGTVQTAVAWGTGPTVPAAFLRAILFPATIGTGIIWTFPRGLVIALSSSLVFWNLAASSAIVENIGVVDE
jgi:hypothetical protein